MSPDEQIDEILKNAEERIMDKVDEHKISIVLSGNSETDQVELTFDFSGIDTNEESSVMSTFYLILDAVKRSQ